MNEETGIIPGLKAGGYTYVLPGHTQCRRRTSPSRSPSSRSSAARSSRQLHLPRLHELLEAGHPAGLQPKILTIGKALLFPQSLEATGDIAANTTVELVWHPTWPFKSSLTARPARNWPTTTRSARAAVDRPHRPVRPMEWLVDSLKRWPDVDDKEEIIRPSVRQARDRSWSLDFTRPSHASGAECLHVPLGGGQWVKGTKYPFDIVEVSNKWAPTTEVTAEMQPMQYASSVSFRWVCPASVVRGRPADRGGAPCFSKIEFFGGCPRPELQPRAGRRTRSTGRAAETSQRAWGSWSPRR